MTACPLELLQRRELGSRCLDPRQDCVHAHDRLTLAEVTAIDFLHCPLRMAKHILRGPKRVGPGAADGVDDQCPEQMSGQSGAILIIRSICKLEVLFQPAVEKALVQIRVR